jgi:DnaK suppressor protein
MAHDLGAATTVALPSSPQSLVRRTGEAGGGRRATYVPSMTNEQREILRRELIDRLSELYGKTRQEIEALVGGEPIERDPGDDADESVNDLQYSVEADLDGRDLQLAHAIERALRAMTRGDYGRCLDCGREIPFERLRTVPWAERCAEDQERYEQQSATHPPTL